MQYQHPINGKLCLEKIFTPVLQLAVNFTESLLYSALEGRYPAQPFIKITSNRLSQEYSKAFLMIMIVTIVAI